jgi:hypothetical protein
MTSKILGGDMKGFEAGQSGDAVGIAPRRRNGALRSKAL